MRCHVVTINVKCLSLYSTDEGKCVMSHILVTFCLEAAFQGSAHAVTGQTPFGHNGHSDNSVATVKVDIQFSVLIKKILLYTVLY